MFYPRYISISEGELILERDEVLKNIFRAKKLRKRELSRLPFKKKIEILVRLQKMAKRVKKSSGEEIRIIWTV